MKVVEPVRAGRYRVAVPNAEPPPPTVPRCLTLVGPMGTGKSTVAARLAVRTGRRLVDLDQVIEQEANRTIAELFAAEGEAAFRRRERAALATVLGELDPTVVATGGGVVVDAASRRLLRDLATVVWLAAPAEVLVERIRDVASRPLLAGGDPVGRLDRIIADRETAYAEVADHRVDVAGRTPDEVVDAILELVGVAA